MQVQKADVINHLREQGKNDEADKAEQELPETLDDERHGDLFERLGVDAEKLVGKLL